MHSYGTRVACQTALQVTSVACHYSLLTGNGVLFSGRINTIVLVQVKELKSLVSSCLGWLGVLFGGRGSQGSGNRAAPTFTLVCRDAGWRVGCVCAQLQAAGYLRLNASAQAMGTETLFDHCCNML